MESVPSTPDLFLDQLIGDRYRLKEYINGGGMGKVYQAVDTRLANKVVAIKLLSQGLGGSSAAGGMLWRRFEEEAKLSAVLGGHPRIIQVTDYGINEGYPYIVMEYLGKPPRGQSLSEAIRSGPMAPERVLRIAIQVCEGLHHAHCIQTDLGDRLITGVVHRDIKPSNIFLMSEGSFGETVKVLDFGIAKAISDVSIALSSDRGFIGTCNYASPEQMRGEPLDPRSDIYSLGVVLYQMLTGEMPLRPKTSSFPGWYQAHNFEQPIAFNLHKLGIEVRPDLAQLIMSCLEKDPERRVPDMLTLGVELEAVLQRMLYAAKDVEVLAKPKDEETWIDFGRPQRPNQEPLTRKRENLPNPDQQQNMVSEREQTRKRDPNVIHKNPTQPASLETQTPQASIPIWAYLGAGAVALVAGGIFFILSQPKPVQQQPKIVSKPKSNLEPKPKTLAIAKPKAKDQTVPKSRVVTDSKIATPASLQPKLDSARDNNPKPKTVVIPDKPKMTPQPQKDSAIAIKPQPLSQPGVTQSDPSPSPKATPVAPIISEAYVQDAGGIRRDIYAIGDTLYFVIQGDRNQLATVKLGKFGTFTMNPSANDPTRYSVQIKVSSLSFPTSNDVKAIPVFRLCANISDSICDKSIGTAITISPH